MARTGWITQIKSGGSWIADGTIFRPNDNLSIPKTSTQNSMPLSDGSLAFISPSTKFIDDPMVFTWFWEDGTTKSKVEAYIENQNDVKIIDHDSNEYIGRFVSIDSVQIVGEDPDVYDIKASFVIMPDLA